MGAHGSKEKLCRSNSEKYPSKLPVPSDKKYKAPVNRERFGSFGARGSGKKRDNNATGPPPPRAAPPPAAVQPPAQGQMLRSKWLYLWANVYNANIIYMNSLTVAYDFVRVVVMKRNILKKT
ncbi:hypothetical protein EVAR_81962_1 [Eumeta japonica]|uniref:Uncharacterized protein n=1 Tax=Eumeta variegata TaxID=151549 RepID=A0A4C1VVT9_EUMVA|nr:hypothetical protein EVAR_81962_1 [Eumeta japonica]